MSSFLMVASTQLTRLWIGMYFNSLNELRLAQRIFSLHVCACECVCLKKCYFLLAKRPVYLYTLKISSNSMEQTFSCESTRSSARQIPRILQNPNVHYRTHKRPPTGPLLLLINPAQASPSHFLNGVYPPIHV